MLINYFLLILKLWIKIFSAVTVALYFITTSSEHTSRPHRRDSSMNHGYVPDLYKISHIFPLHEKDSQSIPANDRPVSLTSHVVKVFEMVIKKKIVHHFDSIYLDFAKAFDKVDHEIINDKNYNYMEFTQK